MMPRMGATDAGSARPAWEQASETPRFTGVAPERESQSQSDGMMNSSDDEDDLSLDTADSSVRWFCLSRVPQIFPCFVDPAVEEEFNAAQNVKLVMTTHLIWKVLALIVLLMCAIRNWGESHQSVDTLWLTLWLSCWTTISILAFMASNCPGRVPRRFDLIMAVWSVLLMVVLCITPEIRLASILDVEPGIHGSQEVFSICVISIILAVTAHFLRMSLPVKLLQGHLYVAIYCAIGLWQSDKLQPHEVRVVAGLLYIQALFGFFVARSSEFEARQHWLLKRAMNRGFLSADFSAANFTSHYEPSEFKGPTSPVDGVTGPHSLQEEAADTLARLNNSLARLIEQEGIKDKSLGDLVQLCSEQVNSCLNVLRQAAAGPTVRAGGRLRLLHQHSGLDEYLEASPGTLFDPGHQASLGGRFPSSPAPDMQTLFSPSSTENELGMGDLPDLRELREEDEQEQVRMSLSEVAVGLPRSGTSEREASFSSGNNWRLQQAQQHEQQPPPQPAPAPGPPPRVESEDIDLIPLGIGRRWHFDPLALDSQSKGRVFPLVGKELLQPFINGGLLKEAETNKCIRALGDLYKKENQYHNACHAADVASGFVCLLRKCTRLWENPLGAEGTFGEQLNQSACVIAALAHDVGHPGRNNVFMTNTLHKLAVTYNDLSILENFHASVCFNILLRPEAWIFAQPDRTQFAAFRKLVVDLILATDIKNHFSELAAFRLRLTDTQMSLAPERELALAACPPSPREAKAGGRRISDVTLGSEPHNSKLNRLKRQSTCPCNEPTPKTPMGKQHAMLKRQHSVFTGAGSVKRERPHLKARREELKDLKPATQDDIRQVQQILMKAADIGHSAKSWPLHVEWSKRVTAEFHAQGDDEKAKGLPVGPLNVREGFDMAKSQCGFLQFVCMPLWVEVARLDEVRHAGKGFNEVHSQCQANLQHWTEESNANQSAKDQSAA